MSCSRRSRRRPRRAGKVCVKSYDREKEIATPWKGSRMRRGKQRGIVVHKSLICTCIMYMCTYMCIYIYIYIYTHVLLIILIMYTLLTCIYIYIYMYIYIYIWVWLCLHSVCIVGTPIFAPAFSKLQPWICGQEDVCDTIFNIFTWLWSYSATSVPHNDMPHHFLSSHISSRKHDITWYVKLCNVSYVVFHISYLKYHISYIIYHICNIILNVSSYSIIAWLAVVLQLRLHRPRYMVVWRCKPPTTANNNANRATMAEAKRIDFAELQLISKGFPRNARLFSHVPCSHFLPFRVDPRSSPSSLPYDHLTFTVQGGAKSANSCTYRCL